MSIPNTAQQSGQRDGNGDALYDKERSQDRRDRPEGISDSPSPVVVEAAVKRMLSDGVYPPSVDITADR